MIADAESAFIEKLSRALVDAEQAAPPDDVFNLPNYPEKE
jgi:hypothetical protein